jgi:hypothetical protein
MDDHHQVGETRRSFWYAGMVGAGVMAAVDEIAFHQLLQCHHFFDWSTPDDRNLFRRTPARSGTHRKSWRGSSYSWTWRAMAS